jgi:hypothetical protein
MARKDLLSEAIADAKAVKETALANAKLALEEAFTPKLQSMISAKLAEELDDEELDGEEMEDELELDSEGMYSEEESDEDELGIDSEDELEEEESYEGEDEEEGEEYELSGDEEEDTEEDDLDLESIIRELEDEMGSEEDEMTEEELDSSEIENDDELAEEEMESDEEEMDLDEVIKTLKEMADEEEVSEEEGEDTEAELEEAYKTIKSLQSTINEVNLLNAKLLYTNKLFRTFDLNESQKVKVLENFDRTSSVREVKLVFSTIAENLNVAKKKKVVVKEGYASKATKSSAPKKQIISEGNEMAARWKKLAGLI